MTDIQKTPTPTPVKSVSLRGAKLFLKESFAKRTRLTKFDLEHRIMKEEKEGFEELGGNRLPMAEWCLHRAAFFRTYEQVRGEENLLGKFKNQIAKIDDILDVADRSESDRGKPHYLHHIVEGREKRNPPRIVGRGGVVLERRRVYGRLNLGDGVGDSDSGEEDDFERDCSYSVVYVEDGKDPKEELIKQLRRFYKK